MRRAVLSAACAALLGLAASAAAHPHAWIVNVTTFVFDGPLLRAVRLTWTFDEYFSRDIVERFDADRNGRFEAAETTALAAGAFANLAAQSYFTHVMLDGREMAVERLESFAARLNAAGRVVYEFTVPLVQPVDPAAVDAIVTVYDDTHFVEIALDPDDPVRFEGMAAGRCAYIVRESLPGGTELDIAPYQLVSLSCRTP